MIAPLKRALAAMLEAALHQPEPTPELSVAARRASLVLWGTTVWPRGKPIRPAPPLPPPAEPAHVVRAVRRAKAAARHAEQLEQAARDLDRDGPRTIYRVEKVRRLRRQAAQMQQEVA